MGNISLRAYFQKIEGLIDASKNDEAIAHCKHILLIYPKNLETYRLLAKAYLETKRYSDALDILQRILSVVPDDFIAHVGMSIIREDEKNLDAAVWHMERAFDVQPSNIAVQDELKRLSGLRDGTEPAKIRLTRGALVRMYLRGNLHTQAIAEARAALKEEPARNDLNVILARAYNLAGLKPESIELARRLIGQLPYCLEAHKILAANPQLAGSDETGTAHQVLAELDPYYGFISTSMPNIDQIPDNSVLIEELDWQVDDTFAFNAATISNVVQTPEPLEATQPASWSDEEISALEISGEMGDDTIQAAAQTQPSQPEDVVPDWMKDAGWQAEDTKDKGLPALFLDEGEGEEIAPAEIPDWLKSLAPQEEESGEEEVGEFFEKLSAGLPGTEAPLENIPALTEPPVPLEEISELAEIPGEEIAELVEEVVKLDDALFDQVDLVEETSEGPGKLVEPVKALDEPVLTLEETVQTEDIIEQVEPGTVPESLEEVVEGSGTIQEPAPFLEEAVETLPEAVEGISASEPESSTTGLSNELPDWLRAALSMDDSQVSVSEPEQPPAEELSGWVKEAELQTPHDVVQEGSKVSELADINKQDEEIQQETVQFEEVQFESVSETDAAETTLVEEIASTASQVEENIPELETSETGISEAEESVDQVLRKDLDLGDEIAIEPEEAEEDLGEPAPLDLPDWLKGYEETRNSVIQDADELKISELAASLGEAEPEDSTEITSPVEVAASPEAIGETRDEIPTIEPVSEAGISAEGAEAIEYPDQSVESEPEEEIDLEEALQAAAESIQNKQNLEGTIDTLLKITEKHPMDIRAWQTLGDAYLKNNQIQQAIDAYTKAETALL